MAPGGGSSRACWTHRAGAPAAAPSSFLPPPSISTTPSGCGDRSGFRGGSCRAWGKQASTWGRLRTRGGRCSTADAPHPSQPPITSTGAATRPPSPLIPMVRETSILPTSVWLPCWREMTGAHGAFCRTKPQAGPPWKGRHARVPECSLSHLLHARITRAFHQAWQGLRSGTRATPSAAWTRSAF